MKRLGQPLFWCWAFVAMWAIYVLVTLVTQRWDGMTISLFGLLGAVLCVAAIESRRRKARYPDGAFREPQFGRRHVRH